MKTKILGLCALILVSTVSASEVVCLNKQAAVEAVVSNVESLRFELYKQSHRSVKRSSIIAAANDMSFSEIDNAYYAGILTRWICAPGAECFASVAVSCDGVASVYTISE
jgi:hypothetical protein